MRGGGGGGGGGCCPYSLRYTQAVIVLSGVRVCNQTAFV